MYFQNSKDNSKLQNIKGNNSKRLNNFVDIFDPFGCLTISAISERFVQKVGNLLKFVFNTIQFYYSMKTRVLDT